MRLLIVVDMQKDFLTGVLGFPEATEIIEPIKKKIEEYVSNGDLVLFTMDTHFDTDVICHYSKTIESRTIPIHCVHHSEGWRIPEELFEPIPKGQLWTMSKLDSFSIKAQIVADDMKRMHIKGELDTIELVGLVTNICVLSCAIEMRCAYAESEIIVDASCCRSFNKDLHEKSLDVMEGLGIKVINR